MRVSFGRAQLRWTLRSLAALTLVLMLAAAAYAVHVAQRRSAPVSLPAPTGPYAVGRTIFEWTDPARIDTLAPQPGTVRELSVWLWYPAAPGPGAAPAAYAPGAWSGLQLSGPVGLGETNLAAVHPHAVADAEVAGGRFPIVVLEPGLGFAAPQFTTLAENLASYGFLVAGVTPTYSANLTVLGGRAVHATRSGNPPAFDSTDLHSDRADQAGDALVATWAADARFAAAQVAALDTTNRFRDHVDPAMTAYLGHSFGGAAALEACRTDTHCAGAIDLDGTQFGPVVRAGLGKPMLLIGSADSCITGICADRNSTRDTAATLTAASTGPIWCYRVRGAKHFNFSDYGVYYLAAPLRSQMALGDLAGDRALTLVDEYSAAFIEHVVGGRAEPLLANDIAPYPEIEVQRIPD
ncbi:hypothetical protein ACIRRA_28415 [Nocardia sp. NPDC101769]|uniref:alpha/beta hydrolase n=1 Tax=Nocardia sp. NPDC101769 TaxID=3364333 RepID=UPI00380099DB